MKKLMKVLPYIIILCCVIFLACMVIKTKERADALTADLTRLAEENVTLQADLAAANAAVAEKDEALIAKETELAEANARLEQAETALTDVLAVVQTIRTELNAVAPVEEAPAEDVTEAPAEEEVVTIEPVEETEAPAEEAPVEEAPAEDVTEAPAEETTEEVPVEE